jgi:hypothetical protein
MVKTEVTGRKTGACRPNKGRDIVSCLALLPANKA